MELADQDTHLALTYLAAATRNGARLTSEQLETFVGQPRRRAAAYSSPLSRSLAESLAPIMEAYRGSSTQTRAAESMTEYLTRLNWVLSNDDGIVLSILGRAILQDLDRPTIDPANEDPLTVVIDPQDPLAYVRVFEMLTSQPEGLLVDPYLAPLQFFDLLSVPGVRRILISDHDIKTKREVLSKALAVATDPPELRYLKVGELHDRFFIPDSGPVLVFGSSLNSITKRPGVVTPLSDGAASVAIRRAYGDLWTRATVIAAKA